MWAVAVGGLITAVPAVWALVVSNRTNRTIAVEAERYARNHLERPIVPTVQLDALERLLPVATDEQNHRGVVSRDCMRGYPRSPSMPGVCYARMGTPPAALLRIDAPIGAADATALVQMAGRVLRRAPSAAATSEPESHNSATSGSGSTATAATSGFEWSRDGHRSSSAATTAP